MFFNDQYRGRYTCCGCNIKLCMCVLGMPCLGVSIWDSGISFLSNYGIFEVAIFGMVCFECYFFKKRIIWEEGNHNIQKNLLCSNFQFLTIFFNSLEPFQTYFHMKLWLLQDPLIGWAGSICLHHVLMVLLPVHV